MTSNEHRLKRILAALSSSALVGASILSVSLQAEAAEVTIGPKDAQWTLVTSGLISVMASSMIYDRDDFRDTRGFAKEESFRVRSGFNPSQLNFIVNGPSDLFVDVAAHFMLASSLQSNKSRLFGNTIETRILEIRLSGKYGTLALGRGLNIFERSALLNDVGSLNGVGFQAQADAAGPAFGRIGTGYTYTDFSPRILYQTPDLKGFQLTVGLFDPVEDGFGTLAGGDVIEALYGGIPTSTSAANGQFAFKTALPRLEAEATYATSLGENASLMVFAGGLWQQLQHNTLADETVSLLGVNGGLRLSFAGLNIRGSASYTEGAGISGFFGFFQPLDPTTGGAGIVCDGNVCETAKMFQWWAGIDYKLPGTNITVGGSYGRGEQSKADNAQFQSQIRELQNELVMGFVHYQVLPFQTVTFEYDYYDGSPLLGFRQRYQSFTVGTQLAF